jgi:hypothetical protein
MATANFPTSPALNQTYTNLDRSWTWNGQYWQSTSATIGYSGSIGYTGSAGSPGSAGYIGSKGESSFTFSSTAPSNPVVGDRWLDSDTMAEVVWTNDGDSNQWVEVAGTGFLGQTGYTGSTGSPGGYTGSASTVAGYTGSTGGLGYTGSIGAGYTGSASTVVGYTGSASTAAGYTGSTGGLGYTGSVGIGFTGSVGIGFTGSVGGLGYTGSASTAAGYTGSVGGLGYTGSASTAAGYTGSAGSAGFVGSAGNSGSVSDGGSNSYAVGYKELPQSATTSGNLVLTDSAKHLYVSAGVTVPPNSTVAFAIGTVVTIINSSASAITITQGAGVTVRQTGTTNTGNRTLAGYGMCSAVKVATDTWYISGGGLT